MLSCIEVSADIDATDKVPCVVWTPDEMTEAVSTLRFSIDLSRVIIYNIYCITGL